MTATRVRATLNLIARLSKIAMRRTPETLLGMPLRSYYTLSCIADAGDAISQQRLGEILQIDANNVVLLLNELEDSELVERVRDPADRRRHLVQITDVGRAGLEHARKERQRVEDEMLAALTADERDTLNRLLSKALDGLN